MDLDVVTALMGHAAAIAITPRFGALQDVAEKAPGELVTIADREAEQIITTGLRALTPNALIVGEEAAADDPALLDAIADAPELWLVGPLDGTRNFVEGSTDHAVMVALLHFGRADAAWILHPPTGIAYVAERGSGAWRDGVRITCATPPAEASGLRGNVLTRFLTEEVSRFVERRAGEVAAVGEGTGSAGITYPRIVEGADHFAAFHRTLPWDHAPGSLLVTEAGGHVARLDGSPYEPGDTRTGLLVAVDEPTWRSVRTRLFPPDYTG